jgi:hypothetical protein
MSSENHAVRLRAALKNSRRPLGRKDGRGVAAGYRFGEFHLDLALGSLARAGGGIPIQAKHLALLPS